MRQWKQGQGRLGWLLSRKNWGNFFRTTQSLTPLKVHISKRNSTKTVLTSRSTSRLDQLSTFITFNSITKAIPNTTPTMVYSLIQEDTSREQQWNKSSREECQRRNWLLVSRWLQEMQWTRDGWIPHYWGLQQPMLIMSCSGTQELCFGSIRQTQQDLLLRMRLDIWKSFVPWTRIAFDLDLIWS